MLRKIVGVGCVVAFLLLGLSEVQAEKNDRIAIFYEEGFPTESPRSIEWYKSSLEKIGLKVKILGVKETADTKILSKKNFDTFILATGGNVPYEVEYSIFNFMAEGGNLIVDGSLFYPSSFHTGSLKHGILKYNEEERIWENVNYIAHHNMTTKYLGSSRNNSSSDFQFRSDPKAKFKSLSSPLNINPVFANLLKELPPSVGPFAGKVRPCAIWELIHRKDYNCCGGKCLEYLTNILLPIYKGGDFCVYRYHNNYYNNSTLIHFGILGSYLLSSPDGEKFLYNALELCEMKLPGEKEPSYYEKVIKLQREMSDFNKIFIKTYYSLRDICFSYFYQGNKEKFQESKKRMETLKRDWISIINNKQEIDKLLESGSDHIEDNLRKILLTRVEAEIEKLSILNEEIDKEISGINYPGEVKIKNPLKRIHFEASVSAPIGIYSLKRDFYKTLKEIGITEALSTCWVGYPWQCYPEVGKTSGIKFPVIILNITSWLKWLKSSQIGILNPLTGDVKYEKFRDYDYDLVSKKISWIISQHKNRPVFGYYWGSEGQWGLAWKFWGEEAKKEYQEHLKGKYKDIKVLNQSWRTNYKAFAEIELLTKRPSALSEHSNWEDWTNFREKKYIDDCQWHYDLIKKNDPDKPVLNLLSHMSTVQPANGRNFYQTTKTADYTGTHFGWHDDHLEWIHFDLNCGKQVFCTEWGVHYWPNQDIIEDTQKMRERLWRELGAGQVGWSIFIWRWAGFSGNYVDMTGLPTLYGWELKNFIEDTKKFDHIILDGKRKEPKIRIIYSDTTRCHDSWANDASKTTASTDGFYLSFLTNHIPARAMAEEEILEGKPIDNYRLIVLPRTEYLSEELQKKILNYVKRGGNILITGDSGKFDNYGHLKNGFFIEAGIAKTKPKKRGILLDGAVYPVLAKDFHLAFSLSPFFPEKTKTLLNYESGEPALLSTSIGKGKIIISGIPFGLQATKQNPEIVEKILDIILKDINLEKRFICEDKNIVLKNWEYGKDEYLILTYPKRKGIKEFVLKIKGKYRVIDYMLGEEIPSFFNGKYTIVRGIILSPGGRVYQLKKESSFRTFLPEKKMAPKIKTEGVSLEEKINENNKESADKDFFYKGRLYASEEPKEIDDYILKINAIVSHADDNADIYLSIRKGRERIEKELEAGKEFFYYFGNKAILVKCLSLTKVYPRSAEIEIRKVETKSIVSACSFSEETHSGSKNLLLKNGLIKVRIVPGAGGRIIEYSTLDGTNHLGGGGIEENAGIYPGPFLNQRFSYQLLKNTHGEVKVLLKMDKPVNGLLLEKVITIKRNSSVIGLEVKKYNYKGDIISSALTIHPNLNIGGDSLGEDTFFIPQKNGIEILPYNYNFGIINYYFTPGNNWAGCVDKKEMIAYITSFTPEEVKQVYIWMGPSNYNLEIFAKDKKLKHLGFHHLNINLSLIKGISGIDSYNAEHGIASYIFLNNTLFSQDKNIKFIVEIGSNCPKIIKGKIFICDKEGEKIKEWEEWSSILAVNKPAEKEFIFSPKGLSDGEYNISFQIKDDEERIISKVQKSFFLIGKEKEGNLKAYKKFKKRLNLLKKKYPSKYQELTKIFISLEEFYVAIEENKRKEIYARMGEIKKALQEIVKD